MDLTKMDGNRTVDVIVIGAGAAGLAAACEVTERGLSVALVEKQAALAETSTALSEGVFSFAGTDVQQREGVEDSGALLREDLMRHRGTDDGEHLVDIYIRHQLDTYRWLAKFGIRWSALVSGGEMSRSRGHVTDPLDMLERMRRHLAARGVGIAFETAATELEKDARGRVSGIVCLARGRRISLRCRRGVVLATGGFGRDPERLRQIDPRLDQTIPVVGFGHSGDGHRMAEALGAGFTDMAFIKPTYGISSVDPSFDTFCVMFYNGAVIVNQEGQRFVNEASSYKKIGKAALAQPWGTSYQILDRRIYEIGRERIRGFAPGKAMYGLDERKIALLTKAATLADLGDGLGMPEAALKKTVEAYNAAIDGGEDVFGRTSLAGGIGKPTPIATPPFYAYPSKTMLPGTYGGLTVDCEMHVMGGSGRIPGLLAAGEIVGGFHADGYMTGTASAKALIFGRIAGKTAAGSLPIGKNKTF